MRELLDQVDLASQSKVYYLALYGALTVPDVAAALSHSSGETSPSRYTSWVRENLESWSHDSEPELLYTYRCRLLHQNSGIPDPRSGRPRLIFVEPGSSPVSLHNGNFIFGNRADGQDITVRNIDLRIFCNEVTTAARSWLGRNKNDPTIKANLRHSIRRHANGFEHLRGVPVIA